MAELTIRTYPDEVLREVAQEVSSISEVEQKLIDDMFETMLKNRGVGLAAPQVGILKRIIVIAPRGNDKELYAYVNPHIYKGQGEVIDEEGCLSVPCASAEVTRYKKIWLRALDRNGKKIDTTVSDFPARIIQHETDHLNGKLFIDHLGFQARKEIIDCARDTKRL